MHTLAGKLGLSFVALLAFFGLDTAFVPPATAILGNPILGQVVAFIASGLVAFVILVMGWALTAKQIAQVTK